MSSRALRKIHGDESVVVPINVEGSSSEEGEGDAIVSLKLQEKNKKNGPRNRFNLLIESGGSSDEKCDDESRQIELNKKQMNGTDDMKQGAKKKKRKKKKKKSASSQENDRVVPESTTKKNGPQEVEDEVDRGIREANEILGTSPLISMKATTAAICSTSQKPLLIIEHKHLNPDNEMKKIFGSHVVKNDLRHRGRNQHHHRSTWLTIPKPSWPAMSKQGLSMQKLSSQAGYNYFKFEHSKDYQQVQFKFLDAVESMDPNNIMELVRVYPYHVDSLLQLSDVSRMSEDTAMAAELIERALYACECALHPLFNLTQANCKIDYKCPENRCLFIAIFKHIKYVGLRGCNRTALEFCKLLLSLDPDHDPLGVLLMIDYYALKSEQYQFLKRLYDEWEAHKNLSQLPNHAFSAAMTYFFLEKNGQENSYKADEMLQKALKMFPLVLLPLLEKCSIQPDKEVLSHPLFAAQTGEPSGLTQLVSLFVNRNYALWKEAEVAQWFERNVRDVIKKASADEDILKQNKEKRKIRFQHAPRNIFRHIILSELKDVSVSLPTELANEPVMTFDPLPPTDSIISYTRPARRVRRGNTSWMTEFFRSLMPSYTPPPPGQVADLNEPPDIEGAVGGYLANDTDLRQGINALMDSMRDLLNNLQPNENEDDQDMEEVD